MQKLEIKNQKIGINFFIVLFSLLISLFLSFYVSSVFAIDTITPTIFSPDEAALIAAMEQQRTASQEVRENKGQDQVSEEEGQYLHRLDEMAAETPNEEEAITYDVPVVVNDKVELFIKYFQTRGRKYFEKWLTRSERYLPMVRDIFRQNGLPEDLAYLALIESGFNPNARSRARAVGMWQFMKWTGRKYGLTIEMWVDERRDPEKATWAAARYLKDLYGLFNSWHLSAASYNAGEGRIMRVIKRYKTDDFWIVAKQKKALKRATDLRVIAKACECSAEEIKELNPELLRWFTPPNEPEYEIKLPTEKAEKFKVNFAAIPPQERLNFLVHKIKRGETLSIIAKRYSASIESILYLNKLKSVKYVKVGTELVVPVRAKKVATPEAISVNQKG
ncbi:MAG: transglycosylase SLT domain-containing protein [Deltaproteobacteria bacterium]|nr:transglycosylase SLT domain-containing protein [Deltaproteobacteria bacterium]